MKNRFLYLDGLKGWMAVSVVLTHYMLALWPKGYIGFGSGIEENLRSYVISDMPWSLFSNTSISLYLLFGMISYLVVVAYRSAGNSSAVLERQASKRYFQFLIPVFAATVGAYFLFEIGILPYEEIAELTGSAWNSAIAPTTDNVGWMLFYAVIGIYFNNKLSFLTVLWCMHIIFIGSFLVYGIWALFGKHQNWFVCSLVFFIVSLFYQEYLVFAAGALSGELFVRWREKAGSRKLSFCGAVAIVCGIVLGLIPSSLLPEPLSLQMTYAAGVFLILTGLTFCKKIQHFLSWKGFVWLGKYLFSIILAHIFVLYTFSAWLYRFLSVWLETGSGELFLVTSVVSLPVVILASVAFYKLFEEPSRKLANYVGKRMQGTTQGN